jgi:uncharacterized cupredoxin-like copper-binding protein
MRRAIVLCAAALPAAALLAGGPGGSAADRAEDVMLVLHDHSFAPETLALRAGTAVRLTLVNEGTRDHEFQVYPAPAVPPSDWNEYAMSHTYFAHMGEIDIALPGRAEIGTTTLFKVHVAPGARVIVWFTPRAKGRFEMASHDPGRSERGLKGTVVVE